MSIPAFAWAIEQGHTLNMTSSQLILLVVMANEADRKTGEFYSGQPRLAKLARLTVRTVRTLIPQLRDDLKLIKEVEGKPGKTMRYRLLMQPQGEETTSSQETTARPATASGNGADPGNSLHGPRKLTAATPETISANPYLPKKEDPKPARESGASALASCGPAAAPPDPTPIQPPRVPDPLPRAAVQTVLADLTGALRGIPVPPPQPPLQPCPPLQRGYVDPIRTPEQQFAELLGISVAEASMRMGSAALGASL